MKTMSDNEITETLQRVLPEITLAEIQELKANEAARERLKAEQGALFNAIAGLLYRYDVEGCIFDDNPHDYEGETGTIIPRLPECQNAQDCCRVVHEEFSKWFDGQVAPMENYAEVAAKIWELWQRQTLGIQNLS